MSFRVLLAAAVVSGLGLGQGAIAQSLKDVDGPAEAPPATYSGTQYVDSKGCVFVRAEMGGKLTWVPRVTSDRKLMCGQTPSLAAAPAPEPAPAANATVATAAAAPAEMAKPTAPAVATAANTPAPATAKSPSAKAKAPRRVVAASPAQPKEAVVLVSVDVVAGNATPCTNAPAKAQRFTLSNGRRFLRCGPPVTDPVRYLNSVGLPGIYVTGVAPGALPAKLPPGYIPAWSDDRLNPHRAQRTVAGDAAMAKVWSNGAVMQMKPGAVLKKQAGKDGRYIQVGAFAVPENADRAAAALTGMGYGSARSPTKIGGRSVTLVFAGPFTPADAPSALASVRGAGFSDAYIR